MSAEDLHPREREGVVNPEVRVADDESARGQDGRRLDHAEGTSKPIKAPPVR